ncbi:hypothetical protein CFP56_018665 [Quercus suber]|uniref:Ribosomal protein S14 n=1 Tax=Quercus suber TaxID=58331 RepID=A0AAW0KK07_QUESU
MRCRKNKSKLEKKRLWDFSRLLRATSWQILMSINIKACFHS